MFCHREPVRAWRSSLFRNKFIIGWILRLNQPQNDLQFVVSNPTPTFTPLTNINARKQFHRLCNCCAINYKVIIRSKISPHSATVCYFFITNIRIHIILQVARKNTLLVGQVIVLQVFDDIHIPILYKNCIRFCIVI